MQSETCLLYRRHLTRWSSLVVLAMTKYNFKGLEINGTMNKKIMGQKNFS